MTYATIQLGSPAKMPAATKQPTHSLPIVELDDKQDKMLTMRPSAPPQCSTQLITNRTPCNISHQALYHIIGLGFTNAPANTIPQSLSKYHKQYTGPLIDIKEYCYGVVHPVTKKTITHYRKNNQGSPAQRSVDQGNEQRTPSFGTRMSRCHQRY